MCIDHPLFSDFLGVSFPLSEWYATAGYSVEICFAENYDDMKRRAISLSISLPTFNMHIQGVWMRRVDKPDILPYARGVDPAPHPAPLATRFSCSKHLNTPHSPLNFNLAILISAPGASKFTSLCDNSLFWVEQIF